MSMSPIIMPSNRPAVSAPANPRPSKRVPAPKAPSELAAADGNQAVINMQQDSQEAIFELGQNFGALITADFLRHVATKVGIEAYQRAKESRAWKTMRPLKSCDGRNFYEDFNEFCEERFGLSYRRMQEISYNFRMIGAELFDKAQRLGLQQRDYAAIKLLPESEKEAVRTVIENAEDREAVVDYVTEVMAKLFKERDELKEEIAAKKAVIANKDKTINELQEESIKRGAESNGSDTEPGEAETALNNLDESVRKAELAIIDAESCIALYARALGVKEDCEISCHPVFEQTANASLRRLFAYCRMAAERFNVPVGGGIDAVDDDESEGREIIRAALQRGNSDDGLADGNVYDHDNG